MGLKGRITYPSASTSSFKYSVNRTQKRTWPVARFLRVYLSVCERFFFSTGSELLILDLGERHIGMRRQIQEGTDTGDLGMKED